MEWEWNSQWQNRWLTYQAEGYGLKNVNDRICLLYGEEYKIRITSSVGKGTVVEMRIPKGETL